MIGGIGAYYKKHSVTEGLLTWIFSWIILKKHSELQAFEYGLEGTS